MCLFLKKCFVLCQRGGFQLYVGPRQFYFLTTKMPKLCISVMVILLIFLCACEGEHLWVVLNVMHVQCASVSAV